MSRIHLDKIKQFAKDAEQYEYPELYWQSKNKGHDWEYMQKGFAPGWLPDTLYRRVDVPYDPEQPEYIIINDVKVGSPYFGEIVSGETYYIVCLHVQYGYKPYVAGRFMSPVLATYQELGLLHTDKRNAVNNSHALLKPTSRKSGR